LNYDIRYKDDCAWVRLLPMGSVAPIYPCVYVPRRGYIITQEALRVATNTLSLQQEFVTRYGRCGILFWFLLYLFPMPLALLSLLAFLGMLNSYMYCFIVFLAALLPGMPSPWRLRWTIESHCHTYARDDIMNNVE
jgi:hypothetical protein